MIAAIAAVVATTAAVQTSGGTSNVISKLCWALIVLAITTILALMLGKIFDRWLQ